ncbi:RNA polymerase sigma factor [Pseudonocardia halophobica]|uniref:RNA polymerase sigma factor n=1 Tax=Pseudonocardia halophobica TaxID=29401 RepID=UPI003D91E585
MPPRDVRRLSTPLPGPHLTAPDVGSVVIAAAAGDEGAWRALVERFGPIVRRVARGFRLDERDTQDVAQTVWLRLWENLASIREPRALPGWIATTARHECLRALRGRVRVVPLDESGPEPPTDHPDPDDALLRAEAAEAVRHGLAELPPVQRDLLALLAAEPDLTYRQIGRRLGMPVGSIGPTRARGLARLGATSAVVRYRAV